MLSDRDMKALRLLKEYQEKTSSGAELETSAQIRLWEGLAARGYARLEKTSISGLTRIDGTFVSLTEAGRSQSRRSFNGSG